MATITNTSFLEPFHSLIFFLVADQDLNGFPFESPLPSGEDCVTPREYVGGAVWLCCGMWCDDVVDCGGGGDDTESPFWYDIVSGFLNGFVILLLLSFILLLNVLFRSCCPLSGSDDCISSPGVCWNREKDVQMLVEGSTFSNFLMLMNEKCIQRKLDYSQSKGAYKWMVSNYPHN